MTLDEVRRLEGVTVLEKDELEELEGGIACNAWDIWCSDGTCSSCCTLHRWFCAV